MNTRLTCTALLLTLTLLTTGAAAQEADKEPLAIVEAGAATSWNVRGGAAVFGPAVAVEVTPIENWLELELGITPFATRRSTEWDTDLLFKKPWTFSEKREFMIGLGPEWAHLRQNGAASDSLAVEVAGDFMFWPAKRHRFGWYLEPAYDHGIWHAHEQSIGITAGVLIAIR